MQLIEALLDLCKDTPAIIAIDGPAGAGKTTLASNIKMSMAGMRVAVVHMDDIYGGWSISSEFSQRLFTLVSDVKAGRSHRLSIFDWHQNRFTTDRTIGPCEILIIEGVGSGQKVVRPFLNALIWMDIDDQSGLSRVLSRDGEAIRDEMAQWQISQRAHFEVEQTRSFADFEVTS